MKRNLSTNGNTWQLYLSRPIVQLMGITADEHTVMLSIENKVLTVTKIENKDIHLFEKFLTKKLIKRGAGFGLNLPIPVLELLDINPEKDSLEINVEGNNLIIKKII